MTEKYLEQYKRIQDMAETGYYCRMLLLNLIAEKAPELKVLAEDVFAVLWLERESYEHMMHKAALNEQDVKIFTYAYTGLKEFLLNSDERFVEQAYPVHHMDYRKILLDRLMK